MKAGYMYILASGATEGLILFGNMITKRMLNEINKALAMGIPIVAATPDVQRELTALMP